MFGVPLPRLSAVLLIAAALAAASGCGSDGDEATAPAPSPTARAEDFPTAKGKATLGQLIKGVRQGPQLAPSVSALYPGRNRFGFALFDQGGKQINGAAVALYTAAADQTDVRGPYPARSESMAVKPAFASKTSSQDPDTAKSVYVADVPFASKGPRVVIALARLDGRLVASSAIALKVAAGRVVAAADVAAGQARAKVHPLRALAQAVLASLHRTGRRRRDLHLVEVGADGRVGSSHLPSG